MKDKEEIRRRRLLVGQYRYEYDMSTPEIMRRLAKADPPIIVDERTVYRDMEIARSMVAREYGRGFDAVAVVHGKLAAIKRIYRLAMRRAEIEKETTAAANAMRVALQALQQYTQLLQDIGLLDRKIGTLFFLPSPEDGKRAERIPSGEEMQRHFANLEVLEGEVVSEAERAWLHGDATASEAAARDTEEE